MKKHVFSLFLLVALICTYTAYAANDMIEENLFATIIETSLQGVYSDPSVTWRIKAPEECDLTFTYWCKDTWGSPSIEIIKCTEPNETMLTKTNAQTTKRNVVVHADHAEQVFVVVLRGKAMMNSEIYFAVCTSKHHNIPEEAEITIEPTCNNPGEQVFKCTACDLVVSKEILPALLHEPELIVTPSTCIQKGKEENICIHCGLVFTSEELPLSSHVAGKWFDLRLPSCTDVGTRIQRCMVCEKDIQTESVPALGHSPMEWLTAKRNGCLTPGERVQKCSVCAMTIATETLPALPHAWTDWVTDLEATATMDGRLSRFCTTCGKEDTIIIPRTN